MKPAVVVGAGIAGLTALVGAYAILPEAQCVTDGKKVGNAAHAAYAFETRTYLPGLGGPVGYAKCAQKAAQGAVGNRYDVFIKTHDGTHWEVGFNKKR